MLGFALGYFALKTHYIEDADIRWISYLSYINVGFWLLNFFWVLNILVFQISSLLYQRKKYRSIELSDTTQTVIPITIIYTTCDDFDEDCCKACLTQNYPNFQVIIADDSTSKEVKTQIDQFTKSHLKATDNKLCLSRRPEEKRSGFKAGNLNYAIKMHVANDWICIVDSDQFIPEDYLSEISSYIDPEDTKLSYIQGVNTSTTKEDISIIKGFNYFQKAMSHETELYYYRDLAPRESYGFLPMLGHGALINKAAWEIIKNSQEDSKGFPEIVAEDFGFTMDLINHGFRGKFAETAISFEKYPINFACFLIRIKKFASGAGELLKKKLGQFIHANGKNVEGIDFIIMYSWYPLSLFFVLNIFLSAYLTHFYYVREYFYMSDFIIHVITLFFVSTLAILISVSEYSFAKLFFWLFSTYTAVMPLIAWNFWKSLFTTPHFQVTPKHGSNHRIPKSEIVIMFILGIATSLLSFIWISPFTPFFLAHGISYLLFPLYNHFHKETHLSKLYRKLIYVPGLLGILAIVLLWNFDYTFIRGFFTGLGLE